MDLSEEILDGGLYEIKYYIIDMDPIQNEIIESVLEERHVVSCVKHDPIDICENVTCPPSAFRQLNLLH